MREQLDSAEKESISVRVIFKAVDRLRNMWKLSTKDIEGITGISRFKFGRFRKNTPVQLYPKEEEATLLFLNVFRKLDSIYGGHEQNCIRWLTSKSKALDNTKPLEVMHSVIGLVAVNEYLDFLMRK